MNPISNVSRYATMEISPDHISRPGLYLKQLREQGDHSSSDMEFVLADGSVERLHSIVAGAFSEKLAKYISGRPQPCRIDMTSFCPECVRKVVDWMYDGEVKPPMSNLTDSLIISHHLGLEELHSQLEQTVRLMAKDDDDFLLALKTATNRATGISDETVQLCVLAVSDRFETMRRSRRHAQNSRSYTPSEIEDIRKLPVEFINERAISEIEQTNEQPDFRPALFSPSEIEDIRNLPVEFIDKSSASENETTTDLPDQHRPASSRPTDDIREMPNNEPRLKSSIDTLTSIVLDLQQKIGELSRKVDILTEKGGNVRKIRNTFYKNTLTGVNFVGTTGDFFARDLNCTVNKGGASNDDSGRERMPRNRESKREKMEEACRLLAVLKETSGKEQLGRVAYVTYILGDALAFEETSQFNAFVIILRSFRAIGSLAQHNCIVLWKCLDKAIEYRNMECILMLVMPALFDGGLMVIRQDFGGQIGGSRNWFTHTIQSYTCEIDGKVFGFVVKRHEVVQEPHFHEWIFAKKEYPADKKE